MVVLWVLCFALYPIHVITRIHRNTHERKTPSTECESLYAFVKHQIQLMATFRHQPGKIAAWKRCVWKRKRNLDGQNSSVKKVTKIFNHLLNILRSMRR